MTIFAPINLYAQRPAQKRSLEVQAAELGLDPSNRSPVEARLGYALLEMLLDPDEFGPPGFANLFLPYGAVPSIQEMPPIVGRKLGGITIVPGCWVEDYQPDYLIQAKSPGTKLAVFGAVECDGFEFHDRTRDQADHDRRRDRALVDHDITVLRFTADNIQENSRGCAHEALSKLLGKSWRGAR